MQTLRKILCTHYYNGIFSLIGIEAGSRPVARRVQGDCDGQNPQRKCAPGPWQIQDASRDSQGQHQTPRWSIRKHV